MKRKPVTKSVAEPRARVRMLGVDPGFLSTGVAILQQVKGQEIELLMAEVIKSPNTPKKKRNNMLRVSTDDSRRLRVIFDSIVRVVEEFEPNTLAIEWYAPYGQHKNGWKTAMALGVVQGVAMSRGLAVVPNVAQDLKRAFGLNQSTSKQAVSDALCERFPNLQEILDGTKKKDQEHVSDAVAHGYLAFAQVAELAQLTGWG
jgi:Holliday junction resolvasome RuvABC endonuclease subunit